MSDVHRNVERVIAAAREAGLEIVPRRFPERGPGQVDNRFPKPYDQAKPDLGNS